MLKFSTYTTQFDNKIVKKFKNAQIVKKKYCVVVYLVKRDKH